jgi:excisionase family DNA binding protein
VDAAEVIAATIRLPQAAKRLRTPERTLRNWLAEGRLPAVRVGGRLRVYPADLDKLVTPVTPRPRPAPPVTAELEGPFISIAEACTRLGKSKFSVRTWIEQGKLRAKREGQRVWVTEESVAAMERQQVSWPPGYVKEWQ